MTRVRRRNDDVAAVVLQAGAHKTGTVEGRHARRAVRVQAQRRQQRGLHRRPMLRVDVQRVLQVGFAIIYTVVLTDITLLLYNYNAMPPI